MTLSADEFIRRFLLHVLPDGYHRIRYYGFLGNRHRQENLQRCPQLLGMASADQNTPPQSHRRTTATAMRNSPAFPSGSARPAAAVG
jgi:hypothetical protein